MPLNSPICDTPVVDPHITSETLAGQTYLRLHRALMTGGLLPEQVLTIRGIADNCGVSLTPAREAIQRLFAEGALIIENARTIRVPRLDIETYREILKIRLELEPMAHGRSPGRDQGGRSSSDLDG
ncbi:MAG: GntR family transcriptional regulator [Burkholderiales bacterium]|nr:GntR family transcriptional regulator [Burkholderiales bacterium]